MSFGKPATIAIGIATIAGGLLVGLLITIAELVGAFGDITHAEADARSQVLSEGISTAMVHGLVCGGSVALVGVALVVFGMTRRAAAEPSGRRS